MTCSRTHPQAQRHTPVACTVMGCSAASRACVVTGGHPAGSLAATPALRHGGAFCFTECLNACRTGADGRPAVERRAQEPGPAQACGLADNATAPGRPAVLIAAVPDARIARGMRLQKYRRIRAERANRGSLVGLLNSGLRAGGSGTQGCHTLHQPRAVQTPDALPFNAQWFRRPCTMAFRAELVSLTWSRRHARAGAGFGGAPSTFLTPPHAE